MNRPGRILVTVVVIAAVGGSAAFLLVSGGTLCTDADDCPCPEPAGAGSSALVVLTDHTSSVVQAAIGRLTADDSEVFENGAVGLDGRPEVLILATYDDGGHLDVRSRRNLAGEGDDRTERQANAELQADCFANDGRLLAGGDGGNLVAAMPDAAELALNALDGEGGEAAVVAFGLSRSHIDGTPFVPVDPAGAGSGGPGELVVDLREPGTRQAVVDELLRTGILSGPQPVAFTFVAPDEGVDDVALASLLTTFAEDELCTAVAVDVCQVRAQL